MGLVVATTSQSFFCLMKIGSTPKATIHVIKNISTTIFLTWENPNNVKKSRKKRSKKNPKNQKRKSRKKRSKEEL